MLYIYIKDIKYDHLFYTTYYQDLKIFKHSKIDSINHFILHGKEEQRIFCKYNKKFEWKQYNIDNNLPETTIEDTWKHYLYNQYILDLENEEVSTEAVILNNNIKFNHRFYISYNKDLGHFDENGAYEHYKRLGIREKRIFCDIIPEFNIIYYMFKYNDVKGSNLYDYWQHYIYHGIKEKRNIDYNTSVDVMQYTAQLERTAVIYVYYNRKNETRNETNLSFFIRQTVLKDTKRNILYLFIINNYDTEVVIPVQDNVIVLKNKNCFDFESYGLGINYLKNKYKKEFSRFNRLVLMNCGVSGPFYNGNNWLEKFEKKLMQENSHACSSILYKLDSKDPDFSNCKQPYRLPGYFVYLKLDDNILNILSNVLCYHNS